MVQRESEFFGNQGRSLQTIIRNLGFLLAWLFSDGYRTSTLNLDTFSQETIAFDMTPALREA